MSDLTNEIRSKGYWRIDIHPADYVADRVPYPALKAILERTVVRLRGWDFPHLERQGTERRGNNWIGSETAWNYIREAWRLYQSGQFVYMRGVIEDWIEPDRLPLPRAPIGVPPASASGTHSSLSARSLSSRLVSRSPKLVQTKCVLRSIYDTSMAVDFM